MNTRAFQGEILLVEDNVADARLIQEALEDSKVRTHLNVVEDGDAAIRFLRQEQPYQNVPRPHLIILDLNLPKKDGKEVLTEIKNDPHLQDIPVVVMTTSHSEDDISRVYRLHGNCYVQKPLELEQFFKTVKAIEEFWFTFAKLPS